MSIIPLLHTKAGVTSGHVQSPGVRRNPHKTRLTLTPKHKCRLKAKRRAEGKRKRRQQRHMRGLAK